MNVHDGKPRRPEAFAQFRVFRVDRDARLRHEYVHILSGRGDAGHAVAHDGQPSPEQRRGDERELTAGSRVAVAAAAAHDGAVGVRVDVDIERSVDLCRAEHGNIQRVDRRAPAAGAGVLLRRYFAVAGIFADGAYCLQIEALHIQQRPEQSLVQHIDQQASDTALRVAAVNPLLLHDFFQIHCRRQRRAACARLEGKAILEKTGAGNDPRGGLRDGDRDGIARHAGRAGDDSGGVTDGVHGDDIIHVNFRDRPAAERIRHKFIGDNNDLFRVLRVREGVAQRTAGRFSDLARAVAHRVAAWRGDECNVDWGFAACNIARAAAVRPELHGLVHDAPRNGAAKSGGHIVGQQSADRSVFDMLQHRQVHVEQRAGVDRQIADAHGADLLHDHVDDIVAVSQMVVKRDAHPVLQAGKADRLTQRGNDLGLLHCSVPPSARISSAAASVCLARAAIGASIIFPRSATAPFPQRFASSMAASTSLA